MLTSEACMNTPTSDMNDAYLLLPSWWRPLSMEDHRFARRCADGGWITLAYGVWHLEPLREGWCCRSHAHEHKDMAHNPLLVII